MKTESFQYSAATKKSERSYVFSSCKPVCVL